MERRKMFMFDTHFHLVNGEPLNQLLYRNILLLVGSCWSFISNYMFYLFKIISRYIFRFQIENRLDNSNCAAVRPPKEDGSANDSLPEDLAYEKSEVNDMKEASSSSGFSFKFQLKSAADIRRNIEESDVSDREEENSTLTTNIRKYSFLSEKDLIGFVQEPEAASFSIKHSYTDWKGTSFGDDDTPVSEFKDGIFFKNDFHQFSPGTEAVAVHQLPDNSYDDVFCREKESDNSESVTSCEDRVSEKEAAFIDLEIESEGKKGVLEDVKCLSEEIEFPNPKLIKFFDGFSVGNQIINSQGYDFLLANNNKGTATLDGEKAELLTEEEDISKSGASHLQNSFNSDAEPIDYINGFPKQLDDYEFCVSDSESYLQNSVNSDAESMDYDEDDGFPNQLDDHEFCVSDTELMGFNDGSSVMNQMDDGDLSQGQDFIFEKGFFQLDLENFDEEDRESTKEFKKSKSWCLSGIQSIDSRNDFSSVKADYCEPECGLEEFYGTDTETANELQKTEETHLQSPLDSDSDESDSWESLWEHEDLIKQLRMELKNVRSIGLPTIYEESESPRVVDDLIPWEIEKELLQEDPKEELHKFYKSYSERMRKLDILNYQKMHAIGFLQLKEPLQSMARRKTSFRIRQSQKSDIDPSTKFIKELQSDLEMVYVGQVCLSWEFLHWQYGKTHELSKSDPHDHCQYNQVSEEFQQFQVLLQRFLENEPFLQGPRVQNYVQNRCVFRKLLQVPAIKDDCLKDKKEARRGGNIAITSRILAVIIEEAMRILWEFIKADKDGANAILKGFLRTQTEIQDPTDSELLKYIQADLQKKEKKLRDLLRTRNCLVKRFQKHQENRSNLVLLFSQVDMKLVSRVLKMSRITTDQLVWCQKKLSKITFTNRKIHREPSFLLFPC